MSYDTYMTIDTGGGEQAEVADIGNYTSNVAWMWHRSISEAMGAATPGDKGAEIALYDLEGKTGEELAPILTKALECMLEHQTEMRAKEPDNGWGNFEGAYEYLRAIRDACARHPKAQLHVSH